MLILCNRANLWFVILHCLFFPGCGKEADPLKTGGHTSQANKKEENAYRILILGDSLTEGYGIPPHLAYPALLENKLNNQSPDGHPSYQVMNGGVTGSTTSGGVSRISWYMKAPPDYLIVALGGNDGLRGIPPEESKQNLRKIIIEAQSHGVPVSIAGMKLPPNYGPAYLKRFEDIFVELAQELKVPLLPFLLEGVGGDPKMNLPDRIHPNPKGHHRICQNVHQHLINHLTHN
jgi:acyl-CoA thioesterase-1